MVIIFLTFNYQNEKNINLTFYNNQSVRIFNNFKTGVLNSALERVKFHLFDLGH